MIVIRWLLALPIIVVCVIWALSNRHDIALFYSPFHDSIDLPLYFFGLCAVALGFLFGTLAAWVGMSKTRKERRVYKKDIKKLETELKTRDDALYKNASDELEHQKQNVIESQ